MANAVKEGDPAPDFDLVTDGGRRFSLSGHRGTPVLIYFYPKDDTTGCTKEAIGFSEKKPDFDAVQTLIVGERALPLNSGRGYATWIGAPHEAALMAYGGGDPDAPGGGWWRELACGMVLGHSGEGRGPGDPTGDPNQFLSNHGRGSHFLCGDGRVIWLANEMDYRTYKALTTRAGGESHGDGF